MVLNTIKVTSLCLLSTNFNAILCLKFPILSKTPQNSQFKRHGLCSQKSKKKPWFLSEEQKEKKVSEV